MLAEDAESRVLVAAHDRRIARDIAKHDRGKLPDWVSGRRIRRRWQRASVCLINHDRTAQILLWLLGAGPGIGANRESEYSNERKIEQPGA
jgi:hypothetical protein